MSLGMEVDLGPGHIVLDWDPAPLSRKGHSSPPPFQLVSIVAKQSSISATAEHLLLDGVLILAGKGGRPELEKVYIFEIND